MKYWRVPLDLGTIQVAKGRVTVIKERCKGCQLCANACPRKCIVMSESLNKHSYHPATYVGEGCTGCGVCFYACPEPGAIRVFKKKSDKPEEAEE